MSRVKVFQPYTYFKANESVRASFEFTREIVNEALRNACYRCELCGCSSKKLAKKRELDRLNIHHYLWLDIAFCYRDISGEVLRSIRNAQVLCPHCHEKIHDLENTFAIHDKKKDFLLSGLSLLNRKKSFAYFPERFRPSI